MFAALGLAALVVAGTAVAISASNDDGGARNGRPDDTVTLDSTTANSFDLDPTIGTNAVVSGEPLPIVDVQTLDGDDFSTADLLGKPLVINVWASTCVPCKKELPAFAQAQAEYGDRVRFVGIDTLGASKSEEEFARSRGVQYELFYDGTGEFAVEAGVASMPQTYFVLADGTIVAQHGERSLEQLRENIETYLLSPPS
jgi:cytochrome c biogenesis protein CcmG/thiol:disulfide interchange protein DsbE